MPKFRVTASWSGASDRRNDNRLVEASDACEALESALPGQYQIGAFESADIHIYRVPDDTPLED